MMICHDENETKALFVHKQELGCFQMPLAASFSSDKSNNISLFISALTICDPICPKLTDFVQSSKQNIGVICRATTTNCFHY